MLLKRRTESAELLTMRYLNPRMELTPKEKYHYSKLEKGYEGEVKFDALAESLQDERYILNDLLFEINNSYFQIDSLIISQGVIHLLDIKNFEGDFYLQSDKLYSVKSGREYKNPLDQLKRSTTLFGQLLQSLQQNYLFESSVIFINPEFTLYQAPRDRPIIFLSQLNRFLNVLSNTPSKLNDGHKKLAEKLISLHQIKNPYTILPNYDYDQLQKGIYCKTCQSFLVTIHNYSFVCKKCGGHEKVESAILRSIEEFKLLFPERKITSSNIHEWCNADLHQRTIARVLKKNYRMIGHTRDTYFE